jgi:hypothetical protein
MHCPSSLCTVRCRSAARNIKQLSHLPPLQLSVLVLPRFVNLALVALETIIQPVCFVLWQQRGHEAKQQLEQQKTRQTQNCRSKRSTQQVLRIT